LLEHGADVLAADQKSMTALAWAVNEKDQEMAALLKSAGADN
jgi:ankyrin repeat protein